MKMHGGLALLRPAVNFVHLPEAAKMISDRGSGVEVGWNPFTVYNGAIGDKRTRLALTALATSGSPNQRSHFTSFRLRD